MKIFVTGATGFVGSHLCDKLVSEGHELYILVRNQNKLEEFKVPGTIINGSLSYTDPNDWISQLPNDIDAVVHTAGIVHAYDCSIFYNINTFATQRLIQDLSPKFSKLHFILVSSMAAAGPSQPGEILTENDLPTPVSEYGRSKLQAEQQLDQHAPKSWQKTVLRPPIVIGPRDPAILDIFKMVDQGFVLMAGLDGLCKQYSFVCVHDLVSVIMASLNSSYKESTQIFFTSAPETMSFGELIQIIKELMGKKKVLKLLLPQFLITIAAHLINFLAKFLPITIRLTKDKLKEITPPAWLVSGEKSREILGVNYQWDLEKTVKETLKDYQNRNWL
jgi:nucleoside-diphosphate-sugar epimerase